MTNQVWADDPKRLVFVLARYKFVAKMLHGGLKKVLEVGCADAFGTRIVKQHVGFIKAIDLDPLFIEDVKERMDPHYAIEAQVHDMLTGPIVEDFDAAYSLDVLEHIEPDEQARFVSNIIRSVKRNGTIIIGTPSLESQVYASPLSEAGHINCKSGDQLKFELEQHFNNVFIFSMNDEVVHTGFAPMAHYLLALCCNPK